MQNFWLAVSYLAGKRESGFHFGNTVSFLLCTRNKYIPFITYKMNTYFIAWMNVSGKMEWF